MKLDNVTVTREDGILTATSRIHSYTFTHGEKCSILHASEHSALSDHPVRWTDKCDCFLSRIDITEINGVPVGQFRRPWWKPRWSYASYLAGVVMYALCDWLVSNA